VLRAAGEAVRNRSADDDDVIATPSHAVLMLGLERTAEAVSNLVTIDAIPDSDRRSGFLQTVSRARFAGNLADDWAHRRRLPNPAVLEVSALLQFLGELLLWATQPGAAKRFDSRDQAPVTERGEVERELFGVSMSELSGALLRAWHLPEFAARCSEPAFALHPRGVLVALATRLAQSCSVSWSTAESDRCLDMAAELLGQTRDRTVAAQIGIALATARGFTRPRECRLARTILLPPGERFASAVELAPRAPPPPGQRGRLGEHRRAPGKAGYDAGSRARCLRKGAPGHRIGRPRAIRGGGPAGRRRGTA
jgi:hypothetical protein